MPRINEWGDWVAGVGGGDEARPVTAVCNGRIVDPGPGGSGDWLNTDEFICARAGYTEIHAIHKSTGNHRVVHRETRGLVGAAWAGGGHFAYRVDGVGYYLDSGDGSLPIVGMGRDGSIATHNHPTNGLGLVVNGRQLSGTLCWDVHVLDAEHVAWRERDGAHAIGIPTPRLLPGESYGLRVAFSGGQWWVTYQAAGYNGQWVLHPVDSFVGCTFNQSGENAYKIDLMSVAGQLHVIAATVESEQLGQIAGPFVGPFVLRDLAVKAAPPVVVTPIPPPVTPKPEPKPMPTIPDSEIARAKAEIAAHPLGDNLPDMPWTAERVANLGGRWGLNGKRGDRNNPSHDIFAYRWSDNASDQPILVDVLGDGGGANIEAFQILPWPEPAGAVWIAPRVVTVPDPSVPSPSPTSTGPGSQIDAELAALLKRLVALENKVAEVAARPVVAVPSPVSLAGARIALRTDNGHYLCAELGGGNDVHARRPEDGNPIEGYTPGTWETFTVRIQ
jgi:hypothetical protein